MPNESKKFILINFTVILTLGLSISFQSLLADWTSPTGVPPTGNVPAPINVSSNGQIKDGSLALISGFSAGFSPALIPTFEVDDINYWVGIGKSSGPEARLHVKAKDNNWNSGLRIEDADSVNYYDLVYTDDFHIGRNDNNYFTISEAGDVSVPTSFRIGAGAPAETLGVDGNISATGDIQAGAGQDICISGGNCLSSVSGGLWSTGAGSDIYYDAGNIGVGITTPLREFHIMKNSINLPADAIDGSTAFVSEGNDGGIEAFGNDDQGSWASFYTLGDIRGGVLVDKWSMVRQTSNAGNGSLNFTYGNLRSPSNNPVLLNIQTNGNVGIGTDNPTDRLQVEGPSTGGYRTGLRIDTDDSSYGPTIAGYTSRDGTERIFFRGSFTARNDQNIYWGSGSTYWSRYDSGQTRFEFMSTDIDGLGTNGEIFTIENGTDDVIFNGGVGFGTNDPLANMHVIRRGTNMDYSTFFDQEATAILEDNDAKLVIVSQDVSSYGSALELADVQNFTDPNPGEWNNSWIIWRVSNSYAGPPAGNDLIFSFIDDSSTVWTYDEIYFTPDGTVNAVCYRDSDNGGADIGGTCTSDYRLKQDIKYLGSDDWISDLKPVSYTRTDNQVTSTQFGLIAQDAREVNPNLVVEDEDGFLKVRYGLELQMGMIQAIKKLKEENEKQKEENRAMKDIICELKPEAGMCN